MGSDRAVAASVERGDGQAEAACLPRPTHWSTAPVGLDAEDDKNRNDVVRAFNTLKNWRGLATRYDRHALIYRGSMLLVSIDL